jgi:hypothetical protein
MARCRGGRMGAGKGKFVSPEWSALVLRAHPPRCDPPSIAGALGARLGIASHRNDVTRDLFDTLASPDRNGAAAEHGPRLLMIPQGRLHLRWRSLSAQDEVRAFVHLLLLSGCVFQRCFKRPAAIASHGMLPLQSRKPTSSDAARCADACAWSDKSVCQQIALSRMRFTTVQAQDQPIDTDLRL